MAAASLLSAENEKMKFAFFFLFFFFWAGRNNLLWERRDTYRLVKRHRGVSCRHTHTHTALYIDVKTPEPFDARRRLQPGGESGGGGSCDQNSAALENGLSEVGFEIIREEV